MLVADEWNGFIKKRKTLRLSNPQGNQRSSYFLSLPYRFAVPLMIASATFHWFISQSVFVMQSNGMAYGSSSFYRYSAYDSSLVGYSNIGMIYSLALGSLMIIALVTLGLCKRYRPRDLGKQETRGQSYTMPLVSTCSAAISAACHGPERDSDAHLLPVKWGFIDRYWCFTASKHVSYPELGPDTEMKINTKTDGSKGNLRTEFGPAFKVPSQSEEASPYDHRSIIEQQGAKVPDPRLMSQL